MTQCGESKYTYSLLKKGTTQHKVKMNSKNIYFSQQNSICLLLLPYRYPFFIKGFQQLYKGKWLNILLLLSFFTDKSNPFNSFTVWLHFACYFIRYSAWALFGATKYLWSYGQNMALWPYWRHKKMVKTRPKIDVF